MKIILGRPIQFFFLLTLLSCFLQVSIFNYVPMGLLAFTVSIAFVTNSIKVKTSGELFVWIVLFNIPLLMVPLIGLSVAFILNINDYNEISYLGRILNLLFLTAFIFALYNVSSMGEQFYKPIKFYWYGTALLALTGIWQLLSFYNLLLFPFETRTNLHSVSGLEAIAGRLTGIAGEPSYFVAFIVDFLILSFLFLYHKKKFFIFFVLISACCLYFAYSPAGYIILLLSLTGPF